MLDGDLKRDSGHDVGGMVGDESAGTDGAIEMTGSEEDDDCPLRLFAVGEVFCEGEDDRAAGGVLDR